MSKSFLIIGLGRFGQSTARMLTTLGHEVLAVDKRADRVSAVKDSVMHAVQADTTDERAIAQLGIRNFDCVSSALGTISAPPCWPRCSAARWALRK